MDQARPRHRRDARRDAPHGASQGASQGAQRQAARARAARRTALAVLSFALRAALVSLPLLALRVLFAPREQPVSGLSDRQLADIGLTRAEVAHPHERPGSAELEIQRLLRGRDWR